MYELNEHIKVSTSSSSNYCSSTDMSYVPSTIVSAEDRLEREKHTLHLGNDSSKKGHQEG